MVSRPWISTPNIGSSNSKTSGLSTKAQAIIIRRSCPVERVPNLFSKNSEKFSIPIHRRVSDISCKVAFLNWKNSFTLKGRWGFSRNYITYDLENSKTARLRYRGSWHLKGKHVEFISEFKDRPRAFRFEVKKKLEKRKTIAFSVLDKKGKPLSFELCFSKKIAKDGQLQLRLRAGAEKRIDFGFYLPF